MILEKKGSVLLRFLFANKGQPEWFTAIFANFRTLFFRESVVGEISFMRNIVEFSLANNGQLFSRINPRINQSQKAKRR